jgi:endonuclease/exonuclease/phosphatase family metal-dependent hydrolase
MDYTHKPEKNEVLQYLVAQDADVICLQEVDVYKSAKFLTLPDVKRTLSSKYPYSYLDFSVYNKRHQYGTMVWSKYPLINKQSIRYESHGNLSNRCDMVVGKDTIRLINNHLESYRFVSEDLNDVDSIEAKWRRAIPVRNRQARIVRREIDRSPYPVIVVGDFNSVACSFAYLWISRGLHDAWNEVHPWSWGATYDYKGIGLRIDYILCSDPLRPVRCSVPSISASDHKPVVATLEW